MAKFKKINFKSKSLWKKIGLGVLAGVVLIGAVFGVTALFRKAEEETQKEINPTYAIGGLTEQGAYLETKESIYTKDAFECQGLNVKLAFDNNISYRIFFYDSEDKFFNATEKLTTNYNGVISPFVYTARIVITPNEDSKISWYEKNGYAKQLTISVDKEQSTNFSNRLNSVKVDVKMLGTGFMTNGKFAASGSSPFYFFDTVDTSNADTLIMKAKTATFTNQVVYNGTQYFDMPLIYDVENSTNSLDKSGVTYNVILVDGDFSYISYDVSSYKGIMGAVDSRSVDCLEIFVI